MIIFIGDVLKNLTDPQEQIAVLFKKLLGDLFDIESFFQLLEGWVMLVVLDNRGQPALGRMAVLFLSSSNLYSILTNEKRQSCSSGATKATKAASFILSPRLPFRYQAMKLRCMVRARSMETVFLSLTMRTSISCTPSEYLPILSSVLIWCSYAFGTMLPRYTNGAGSMWFSSSLIKRMKRSLSKAFWNVSLTMA